MSYSFNVQKRAGRVGEALFEAAHSDVVTRQDGLTFDFIVNATGAGIELKTDLRTLEESPFMFIERYSNAERATNGGPWQAREKGALFFTYFYVPSLVYYRFDTQELIDRLESKPRECKFIQNKTYRTAGFLVPREELKDIYKEVRLNVCVSPSSCGKGSS